MSEGNYLVVVNGAGQYSLWPDGRPLPDGWTWQGYQGDREGALAHIDILWQQSPAGAAMREHEERMRQNAEAIRRVEEEREQERLRRIAEIEAERRGG